MEQRRQPKEFATVPALDVSLRVATPLAVTANNPDDRLPDMLPFALICDACERAIAAGNHKVAWRAAQSLLRRAPESLVTSFILGQALVAGKQAALAIPYFQLILKRNPTDARAWYGLTHALQACAQTQPAKVTWQRAVLNQPLGANGLPSEDAAGMAVARGVLLLKRGMPELASVELLNTMRTSAPRPELHLYYIESLRQSGRLDEAMRLISHFDVELEPSLPVLWLRAVLSDSDDVRQVTRASIQDMDPDGRYAQTFFAPNPPPWPAWDGPELSWDQDLVALSAYLVEALDALPTTVVAQRKHADVALTTSPAPAVPSVTPIDIRDGQVHMVLAHRQALVRRFGHDAWQRIDAALRQLQLVLQRNGLTVVSGYIDDPVHLQLGDVRIVQAVPAEAMAVRDLVRSFSQQLKPHAAELTTLLLIGGDDCIPFHRLQNPIPDDERTLLSDSPYACDDAGYLIPQRIVARLPEGEGASPELLLQLLERMTTYHTQAHHQGQLGFDVSAWLRIRSVPGDRFARGIAAEVWQEPSRVVLQNLHPEAQLLHSPPVTSESLSVRMLAGREVLYLNLHGAAGMAHFYGQPQDTWGAATALPIALTPQHMTRQVAEGTIVISEACYGAELQGRTPDNSIALQALYQGARAFVGATVNAYGSAVLPLLGADLLFERLTYHLANGMPIGLALYTARLEFAQIMFERQGFLDDVDIKTLIEFILLGDPWATLKGQTAQPSIRHTTQTGSFTVVAVERVPKMVRRMLLNETDVSPHMLRRAKEVIQKYLPMESSLRMSIMATTNPYYQSKGVYRPDVRFSSKALLYTSDGNFVPRNVHVTMHNDTLTKTVLSR